ncbi:MAG TPA: beta-ketoacyl-ACP synthase II [Rectinemataceae bacterium]|nr:beta-ketoacyl-ACP synthase II [Rectinemataceae bacterium]
MANTFRRVAVTGMGVIHGLGTDPDVFWSSVAEGKSGIVAIEGEEFSRFPTRIAAAVTNFPEELYLDRKESKNWDRYARFAVWASLQAWERAKGAERGLDGGRIGVWLGTGFGGAETLLRAHDSLARAQGWRSSPFTIPMMIGNMGAGLVSMALGARGPCIAPVSACATGNNAIGEAFLAIRDGRVDMAVAGGAEAPILPVAFSGFNSMRAMSTRNEAPAAACAPFDRGRDGFVMGEGAGVLVLEDWEGAQRRGADILAEVAGYGSTADAYHLTAPDPEGRGATAAMSQAAAMAGWTAESVDYINAHGTGTPVGDAAETRAVKAFAAGAGRVPPISSTKGATGHLFGAAGGIEAIVAIQAIRHGLMPPTLNLVDPDPECDLDYVPLLAREAALRRVLSNGFGFGGHNAVLAFAKA